MLAPLRSSFVPNRVVIVTREGEELDRIARLAPLAANKRALAGRTTAYVCEDRVCAQPTDSPETFAKQLDEPRKRVR